MKKFTIQSYDIPLAPIEPGETRASGHDPDVDFDDIGTAIDYAMQNKNARDHVACINSINNKCIFEFNFGRLSIEGKSTNRALTIDQIISLL